MVREMILYLSRKGQFLVGKPKKAQVTIFVILALILVVAIILLFLLINQPDIEVIDIENPQAYIESCTRDAVEEAIDIISSQGGDIIPQGSVMYMDNNLAYLCYNANYYEPCINQRPMLIEHIEGEIDSYIWSKVDNCFNFLKAELEKKNYDISMGEMVLTTKLQSKQVVVDIARDFKMSKNDETQKFKNFRMNLVHSLYDLVKVAVEIVNQEARYCNFDILGFMIFYPEYDLDKFRTGDSDVIYTIRERGSRNQFIFAVRSCALPPGF